MIDYHLHGNFSGHGSGELVEYVEVALEKGFAEIGFSDHLPKVIDPDPYHAMLEKELPRYVRTVLALRERYHGRISIKLGIEADYFEGYEEDIRRLLEGYPFDYVLGSIHFLGDWHFTSKKGLARYSTEDPAAAFPRYFELLEKMIKSNLFDIAAHADALRRSYFLPAEDLSSVYERIAILLAERGMAIEVNTGGLRRNAGSLYPAREFLAACVRRNVPLTLGSDAHSPADVGKDYDIAFELLSELSVQEIALFERRKLQKVSLTSIRDRA